MKLPQNTAVYSVSRLNNSVKDLLQTHFLQVWVKGELSNLIKAGSGHWYFKLKDQKAQVQCAMFKGNNRHTRFTVENGVEVLIKARVSLYEPRGDYQLIAEQMEPAGEGALKQAFEQLKFKLAAAGLFSESHKQALPKQITKIGIITSPTGAALQDILSVLARRAPNIEVIVYPSLVQGDLAPNDLISAITIAGQRQEVDVLIVGRGGGSIEDLWAFNDEQLANVLYRCPIPTISAVGHEIDYTISDFVADLRAPTPSAAAEIASQFCLDIRPTLQQYQNRANIAVKNQLHALKHKLSELELKLNKQHPLNHLLENQQRVDELQFRLNNALNRHLSTQLHKANQLQHRLAKQAPDLKLSQLTHQHAQLSQTLTHAMQNQIDAKQYSLALLIEKLQAYSPLATLARGYSISKTTSGELIRSSKQVALNDELVLTLHQGELKCQINEINK